jgi:hypothetical protein
MRAGRVALGTAYTGSKRQIALFDDVGKRNRRQKAVDLAAKRCPQLVGDAFIATNAAFDGIAILATGDLQRFINS